MRTIRLLHRIAVDWTSDTSHQPREARVLRSWHAAIGRLPNNGQARP